MQGPKKLKNLKIYLPIIEKMSFPNRPANFNPLIHVFPWSCYCVFLNALYNPFFPSTWFNNNLGVVGHAEAFSPVSLQHYLPSPWPRRIAEVHVCSEYSFRIFSQNSSQCRKLPKIALQLTRWEIVQFLRHWNQKATLSLLEDFFFSWNMA